MKKTTLAIIAILVLLIAAPAMAASLTKTIDATYGITIVLDGKTFSYTSADGKKAEAFVSEGTTYLPLRALAEALGLGVAWDGGTQTVTLTTGDSASVTPTTSTSQTAASTTKAIDATYGITIVLDGKTFSYIGADGKKAEAFVSEGTTYLPLRALAEALGLGVAWDDGTKTVTLTRDGDSVTSTTPTNPTTPTVTSAPTKPTTTVSTMVYIASSGNGTKYHSKSSCSSMNGTFYITKEEAKGLGYTPCSKCH